MGKSEELTATDKLLQVIKSKTEGTGNSSPEKPSSLINKTKNKTSSNFRISQLFSNKEKKSINIGIDIGKSHLRLVKAAKRTSRDWRILDMASFPYPAGSAGTGFDHKNFIENKIKLFCNPNECNLWAISYSQNIEIRHIRIPKVARKEISNAVYWTFKKEFPYDEAEFTLDYEIQEELLVGGTAKLSIMAYLSPKSEIEALKNFFLDMGLNTAGITIRPFAVHNILKSNGAITGQTIAFLYIGEESSRIDIYAGGNLTMTRVIKAGTRSLAEALCDGLREAHQECSHEDALKILNRSFDADSNQIVSELANISKEQIYTFLGPALDRIVRQAERTFDYYSTVYGQGSVQKVIVYGEMTIHDTLTEYLGNQLGLSCQMFDPAGKDWLENIEPLSRWSLFDRAAFIPALGAACSENYITINLLYGYRDKETEESIKRINRAVLAGFLASLLVCTAYFINQNIVYSQKKNALKSLESRLSTFRPVIDRTLLSSMAGQVQKTKATSKSLAERYQSMAILSEISSITPREIKLIRLDFASHPNVAVDANDRSKVGLVNKSEITIEGIIQGEQSNLESLLTGYTFKLDSSPLFETITIQKSNYVPFPGGNALQFVVNAKIS